MSSYRKLARKQALRLGLAVTAMVGGMTGWHTAAYADGATDIQKMDAANAGTITTSNNVWTVVPDKVEGDLATNAFSKFILDQNNVANLQMYKGGVSANTLVNMVQGRIDIRGTVNVLKNATTIGGNVFFLSPEGMAVGRTGVINAGSITALAPSTDWFKDHLQDNHAKFTAADMDALKAGTIPLNADGSIVIDGHLNAQSGIRLGAPVITVGSAESAAQLTSQNDLNFAALVNAGSTSAGLGTLTATTGAGGDIVLAAASNRLNNTTDDVPKYTNPLSGSKNEIKAELTVGKSAAITGDRNVVLSSYAEHTADENEAFGGTSSNTSAKLLGQSVKTTANTTVNGSVTADGRLSATAKAKNIASEAGPLSNPAGLADEVAGVIAVNVDPSYMIMGSEATVKIGADAALTAKGADLTVTQDGKTVVQERALIVGADARSSVDAGATTSKIKFANIKHTNAVPAMAVAYAKAQSAANVTVEGHLTAEQGSVDVHAKSREDLIAAAHAKTTQLGAGADSTQIMNVAVLVARGNNDAQVEIGQGAAVTAEKQADITADATSKLETSASASGKENSLLNVAVNVTKQTSAAHTEVRGTVTGKTGANIHAYNTQLKNSAEASTAAGKSGMITYFSNAAANTNTVTGLTQKIKNVIGGIRSKIGFPSDGLSSPIELDKLGEKISLGGAVNVLNEEQQANVLLAPHAVVRSDGAVKIDADSIIRGTHVRAQSAVNSHTDPNWYLTEDGKTERVQAHQTKETQGMGSFAVNVANIKNTAGVTTLAAEESGTSYAPNITGKSVDITADGHVLYTNIDDMISELRASFEEFKQYCAAFQGTHAATLTAAQDKAEAYLKKCDNDSAYIVSKEGLKEAKELAAAIKAVADVLKEDVTVPANLAERALVFANPSSYLTFQASAKFSGKGATQEKPDAEQAKIAGAAGVNFADVDNHAAVVLGRGTKVTATDEVTVAASSKKQLVTLVGAPAWQAGADIAIGGNLGITVGDTTADTIVAEGTEITGRKAAIKATNSYDGIHLAVAAGKGGKIGFQGMANYVGGTSGAVTSVDDEAKITAAAAAQMNALNTTNITNIAGSAVLGTGAAIGLSAALNNVAQTSIAAIADNDAAEETPQDKTAEQRTEKQIRAAQKRAVQPFGNVNAADLYGTAAKKMAGAVQAETLDVHAEQKGLINAAAAAGAIATGDDTSEKGGIFDKIGQTVTTGKNMVGNGITKIDNKLQDLVGSSLKRQAEKKTVPLNAVKNLGFNQKQPPFTLDLAGSASVNLSKVTTAAEVKGANVTLTKNAASPAAMKNLTVSAQDSSFTGAWGGALAVTWKTTTKSQNEDSANAGIAGAASVNVQRHRDVLALMSDNRIKGADSIENVAVQKGATVAAALGLSVMKTSGNTVTSTAVPVSLTYNEGGSVTLAQMRDNYINAAADGTALTGIQKTALSNRAVSSNTQVSGGVSAGLVFGSKSSNAVGAVVAVSNLRNDVHADISQTRKDTGALRNIGALTNEAVSGMTQIGAAIGVGAASGSEHAAAVTGSFAVNNFANKTAAQLTRVTLTADSANVRADDKHEAGAYQQYLEKRGIETSGDKYQENFAKGKSNSSLAVDQDGNLTHSGGSTIVTAAASISAAAGSSAATAAGIGVGVGVIKNDFTAGVSGSDLELQGAQGLNVESVADTRAINVAAGVAGSGGIAAAGSASVIATNNETSAIVEDSTIKAQKLQANALTKSLLVNVAGQISVSAGGAGVAAGLATAVNMIDNNTTAALRGGRLTLSHDGIVNLNAQNIGGIEALTAGVAAGTQAAVSGAISVNVGKNDTCAEIAQYEVTKGRMVDAEIRGAKSVRATTLDQTRQDAAVGGVSASTQGGAVGASVAFNALLKQQNTARISGAKIGLAEGGMVDVNAKNEGTLNTVALNVAGSGGSVAFAGAAAVADVDQDTTAEIVSSDIEAEADKPAGDVNVQADGKLTARTFAIVGSGSSEGAAIGAGVAVNLLDADTNATISGGKIHAANVLTNAAGNLNLHNIGMGIAATGSGAAGSGSIAVNKLNNDTTAKIAGGAKVTAEKNAVVSAKSDDRIQNYAGQLTVAGTGAAIGLSTSTNIIGSNTKAEISGKGTEVISHATDGVAATQIKDGLDHEKLYNGSLTVDTGALIGLDGLAEGRKATEYRGVAVSASATHTANSFIANGGGTGTGAAVNGTINTNIVGGSTTAQIADATAKAVGADVSVRADDATNSGSLVGTISVAGEGAALGTGSSINLINRTTEAEAARSTISAKKADIAARSAQGIAVLTVGVSFADEFGLANSNNFVRMEQSTRAALMNSTVNVSGLSVTADNTANLNAFAKTLGTAGYGVAVGVGTAVLLDRSTTEADIAGTKVFYTDDKGETLVHAKNTEHLNNYVFSIGAAGITGVGASISGGDVKNTVKAAVTDSALGHAKANDADTEEETAAKKITVTAENNVNFDQKSGTGGAGIVGASVGVSVNNFKATVESVVNNSKLYARESADITAHDSKTVKQLATNGAGGIAAVGLNIMVTNVGAEMQDSYTMEEGSSGKKQSVNAKEHTDKTTEMQTKAGDRSKTGLSYVSSNEKESATMLAEKATPSTDAKTSARAERSDILVATKSSNGKTRAGELNISAQSSDNISQDTVQAGIGGAVVSGAAGIVRNRSNVETVAAGGTLSAHTIKLDAVKDGAAGLKIYQGAAAGLAVNAAYGELNMGGRNDLVLSGTKMRAHTITGTTRDETTGAVDIIGVAASLGGAAANILVGNAHYDNAQTLRAERSTLTADGDLTLSMTRTAKTAGDPTLRTTTEAASGGMSFAGNGVAALARETGSMTMNLVEGNTLSAAGDLALKTDNRANIQAETKAVSASIFAAATATYASASFGTEKNAYQNRILIGAEDSANGRTDRENSLTGKTITISAETNAQESAHLKALSASAGAGVQASGANINAYSDAKTLLASGTNYRTAAIQPTEEKPDGVKELQISTKNIHTQDLDARGLSTGSLFATATNVGAIKNVLHSNIVAYGAGSDSTLNNAALTTRAEAVKKGKADGSGGALVAISPIAAGISDDTTLGAQTKLMGTWRAAGALDAKASTYDNSLHDVDALQAAIVGGSGTRLTKTLAQNAAVSVENAQIETVGAQNYEAKNVFSHADKDAASGYGAGTLSAGEVSSNMTETAKVTFKNSSAKTTGYAGITAQSLTEGTSKTTGIVKSAGVIPFTMMNGSLGVTYDNTVDAVDSHLATAKADANIALAARDNTEIRYEMNADTQGGLAGTASAALTSNITRGNTVRVDGASTLFSSNDVNLYTGRGIDPQTGERNLGTFKLSLLADATNRTGIPLRSAPKLDNKMTQTNTVSIERGAQVESVRHANLSAVSGYTQAYESATAYNIWSGKGAQSSLTTTANGEGDRKGETRHNEVQVDGSVTAGIHNRLSMSIRQTTPGMSEAKTNELAARLAAMTPAQKEALVQKTDVTEEERLLRDIYLLSEGSGTLSAGEEQWLYGKLVGTVKADITDGGEWFGKNAISYRNLTLNNPYLAEYNELMRAYFNVKKGSTEANNLKDALGSLKTTMEAEGFVAGDTILPSRTTIGLVLPNLAVSGGDVNLEADAVSGTGSLTAKGAPVVNVQSAAERRLIVQDVKISDPGGRVRLGETDLKKDQFGGKVHADTNTSDSAVTIHSTAAAADADIELHGDIITPGTITIKTDSSSIRSTERSNMRGANIKVEAPKGAVSQSSPNGTVFIGGDPRMEFSPPWMEKEIQNYVSDQLEKGNKTPLKFNNTGDFYSWLLTRTNDPEKIKQIHQLANKATGSWVAGKDISIAARNVNINGIIQSGYTSYKVRLDQRAAKKLEDADRLRTEERLLVGGGETYWDDTGKALGYSPAVYYNAKEGYLFTDAMETGGGNITITGAIYSTGSGRIRARSGESDIDISTSGLARDLHLGAITNRAGGGRVTLNDRNTGKTTEYLSDGTYRSYTIGAKEADKGEFKKAPKGGGGEAFYAYYDPKENLTYNWTGGRSGTKTQTSYSYGERFLANGHWTTGNVGSNVTEKNIENGTVRVSTAKSNGDILPNGVYFGTGNMYGEYYRVDGDKYESDAEVFPDPPAVTKYYGKWQEKDGKRVYNSDGTPHMINEGWGSALKYGIYFHQWNKVSTKGSSNTYRIYASNRIYVEFPRGRDKDNVNVPGGNVNGYAGGKVNVHAGGNLILDGAIRNITNSAYTVNLHSDRGRVESNLEKNGVVYTNNLNVVAGAGIKLHQSAADAANPSKLDLNAGNGAIDLTSQRGALQIVNARALMDTAIHARGSIRGVGTDHKTTVWGDNISLTSEEGGIDLSVLARSRVDATAKNDINLTNKYTGDMRVGRIESKDGGVYLTAEGAIVDAMPEESKLSDAAERMERWRALGLTNAGDQAHESAKSAAAAKKERLDGLESLGKAAARSMSGANATDAEVQALYEHYKSLSEKYLADEGIKEARADYLAELKASHKAGWSAEEAYARTIGAAEDTFFAKNGLSLPENVRTFIRDYKTLDESDSYGWSVSGLRYAIQQSAVNPKAGQVTEVKTPNIIGRSISLTAGTGRGIGENGGKISIANADLFKEENLITLANARAGEMHWTADGVEITHTRPVKVQTGRDKDDVRLMGNVDLKGDEHIYVASKESALRLGKVSSNGDVYLQGTKGIYGTGTAITAKNLSLYGGTGGIYGISPVDTPLLINVSGVLDANADGNIHIEQDPHYALTIQAVSSNGDVVLTAHKGMQMTTETGKTGGYIKGAHVTLQSEYGNLGTEANRIRIASGSLLRANTGDRYDVHIANGDDGMLLINALKGENISVRSKNGIAVQEEQGKPAEITAGEGVTIVSEEGGIALGAANVATKRNVNLSAKGGVTQSEHGSIQSSALDIKSDAAIMLLGEKNSFHQLTMSGVTDTQVGGSVGIARTGKFDVNGLNVKGDVFLKTDDVLHISGALTATGNAELIAGKWISLDEAVTVGKSFSALAETGDITYRKAVTAGENVDTVAKDGTTKFYYGVTAKNGNLTALANHDLEVGGDVVAGGSASLTAGRDLTIGGYLKTGGALTAYVGNNIKVKNFVIAGGSASLTAGQAITLEDLLKAGDALSINTDGDITLNHEVTAGGDLSLSTKGNLTTNAEVVSRGAATVDAKNVELRANLTADKNLAITAKDKLVINEGVNLFMKADGKLKAGTASFGTDVRAGGALTIDVDDQLTVHDITAGGNLNASALKINAHDITAVGGAVLSAKQNFTVNDVRVIRKHNSPVETTSIKALRDVKVHDLDIGGDLNVTGWNISANNIKSTGKTAMTATEGDLTVVNLSAGDALDAVAKAAMNVDTVTGGKSIALTAQTGYLRTKGEVRSDGDAMLTAGYHLTTEGALTAGGKLTAKAGFYLTTKEAVTAGKDVSLSGKRVKTERTVTAGGALTANARENLITNGTVTAGGKLTANVGEKFMINGAVTTGGDLSVTVKELFETNAAVLSHGAVQVEAQDVKLYADFASDKNLAMTVHNYLFADWLKHLSSKADATLKARVARIDSDVRADGKLTIETEDKLSAENISAGGDAVLNAGDVFWARSVDAAGNADIKAGKRIVVARDLNVGGDLNAQANEDIAANDITSKGKATLTAQTEIQTDGSIRSDAEAVLTAKDITIGGAFSAHSAQLTADENATLGGKTEVGETLMVHVGKDFTANAEVLSHGTTTIEAQNVNLNADLMSDKNLAITAKDNIITKEGTNLSTKADGRLKARTVGFGGDVRADGTLTIETDEQLAAKNITAGGDAVLTPGTDITVNDVTVGGNLNAKAVNMTAENITAGGNATLNAGTDFFAKNVNVNGDASIAAGTNLTAHDVNVGGDLDAKAKNITVTSVTGKGNAVLTADKDVTVTGAFSAHNAELTAGENMTLGGKTDVGGTLTTNVAHDLTVNDAVTTGADFAAIVGNNAVTNGIVTTNGALKWNVGNDLTAHAAVLSHGTTTIDAQNVNLNADLMSDKNLAITAKDNIITKEGTNLSTKADGRLKARTVGFGGDVRADGTLTIETDEQLAAKNITAGGDAVLTPGTDITVNDVTVGGNLNAKAVNMTAENITAGGNATLNAGTDFFAKNVNVNGDASIAAGTNLTAHDVNVGGDLDAKAKNITVTSVTGKGNAVLTADKDVTVTGAFSAHNAELTAGENMTLGGKTDVGGTLTTNVAHDLTVNDAVTTGADFAAIVGNNAVTNGIVTTNGALKWNVGNDLTAHAAVLSHGTTTIEAQNVNLNADLMSDKNLAITAKDNIITKEGTNLSTKADGRLKARTVGFGGDVRADGTLTIETDEQLAAKNITAGGDAVLTPGTDITVNDVTVGGNLNAKAVNMTAENITAGGNATLNAGTDLFANNVNVGGAANIAAGTQLTAQNVTAKGDAVLRAGADLKTLNVAAGKDAALTAEKNVSVHDVMAGGNVSLTAGHDAAIDGAVKTGDSAILTAKHDAVIGGAVTAGGDFSADTGNDLIVNGAVTVQKNLTLHTGNDLTLNGAALSHGMMEIDAGHDAAFNGSLTSDKNLSIIAKNNITVKEGADLYTKADGQIKAHTATLGGNVKTDGTLTIGTEEQLTATNVTAGKDAVLTAGTELAAKNITAGGNASLTAGSDLAAKDVTTGGSLSAMAQNITAENVTAKGDAKLEAATGSMAVKNATVDGSLDALAKGSLITGGTVQTGGNASLAAGTDLAATNVTTGGNASLTAGKSIDVNEVKSDNAVLLNSGTSMTTGTISGDTLNLHATDGDIHSRGTLNAVQDASISTDRQGAITLEKALTAGKDITLETKNGDMLFGGDVRSKGGSIQATIAAQGDIKELGDAKVSVEAAAKGVGNVTLTNKGTGDIDLHRVYADRDIHVDLAHGNIHVYEINGALVAVVLKDAEKKMALENIIAERRMIAQGSDMNFDNIRVREGADGMLSIEPTEASDDRPIDNFTMGNIDPGNGAGVKFEKLWANNMKLTISGGKVRFDKLFIEGKADIAYAGQETSIYGTSPQIDGNVVTYWNDVNRNNPRTNKEGWTGMYLSFTGANRQESNGNLLSLSNYRFVYPQRENLVDFMGHALQQDMDAAFGGLRISTSDGKALAMQEQAEAVDVTVENAKEDAIRVEM
ncbi:leukotoxin LktA family filamentous adhesin [Selenomonas massiliensis]|uniref:leukotoxin LktA family filamentous adhesin n=1 Tax=Selenomonas massiliensis TaxID=2058293 RepID=UPI00131E1320|nr:leukotoxin LktA family filamentous adhesin [Selenomonas massiliensis]